MKGKYAGGIASRMGRPYGGQICYIKNCYSTAEVISTGDECGGIVGSMYENSEVSYCYSTGVLIGANSVGGIAALPSEGAKNNCLCCLELENNGTRCQIRTY